MKKGPWSWNGDAVVVGFCTAMQSLMICLLGIKRGEEDFVERVSLEKAWCRIGEGLVGDGLEMKRGLGYMDGIGESPGNAITGLSGVCGRWSWVKWISGA